MGRSALFWVAVAALLGLLTGCGIGRHQFRDERTEQATINEIAIDGGSGSVTVHGGGEGSVTIKRHVWYVSKKPSSTTDVNGSVLTLHTECPVNCSVDYDVTAPAGVKVTGHTGSGNVTVSDVADVSVVLGSGDAKVTHASGAVNVRTDSGNIELTDVKGSVAARASSGDVKLTDLAGSVVVDTSSGDVNANGLHGKTTARASSGDVTLKFAAAVDVTAQTDSGDLKVMVPGDQHYRVDTSTSSGDVHRDVSNDTAADHHLELRTSSGDITVMAK